MLWQNRNARFYHLNRSECDDRFQSEKRMPVCGPTVGSQALQGSRNSTILIWAAESFLLLFFYNVTLINISWEQIDSLFILGHSLMRGRSDNRDRQRRRHQMLIACFEGQAQQEENNNVEFPSHRNKSMNNDSDARIWRVLLPWWTGNVSLISSLRFVSSFVVFFAAKMSNDIMTYRGK